MYISINTMMFEINMSFEVSFHTQCIISVNGAN